MAEAAKSAKEPKKVNDISKPSATPTSRPIIVTHSPVMKDPTLVNNQTGDPEFDGGQDEKLMPQHEVNIKPPEDLAKEPEKDEAAEESSAEKINVTVKKNEAEPPAEAEEQPKPLPKEDEKEPDSGASQKEDNPEKAQIDQDAELKKQELAAQEAKAIHDAEIDQLVSEEKYFLPVNRVEKRRQHFVVIGAIIAILLAVAWLDVALDAGLISNTFHLPHTNFFSLKN